MQIEAKISYKNSELSPILSEETIDFHYGKHHCGYAKTLNSLIVGTEFENMSLENMIVASRGKDQKIFNNASQVFNHDFYWKCLKKGQNAPEGKLKSMIDQQFNSFDAFLKDYIDFASTMFGSGWSWLVEKDGILSFLNTQNAENPIGSGYKPVCVIDLWEHAYYIDYRNNRASYIENLIKNCINWQQLY